MNKLGQGNASGNKKMRIVETERSVDIIGTFDVCVVGGGFAGVAAALAAARNGASVCLLEKTCSLGGLGTLGLVVDYLPLCDGKGHKLIGGIGEELLKKVSKYDMSSPPDCWKDGEYCGPNGIEPPRYELTYNPNAMVLLMEELLIDDKVTIFYDTLVCNVVKTDNKISEVIIENKSGRSAVSAKTVIDASGDADVCKLSGEVTMESHDNVCAWWFYSQDEKGVHLNRKSDNFYKITDDTKTFSGTDSKDVSALCIETRNRIRAFITASRTGDQSFAGREMSHDGSEVIDEAIPSQPQIPLLLPTIPQFRMTRRLTSENELTEDNMKQWSDTCIGIVGDWRKRGPAYSIPFEALLCKTDNLLTAGRCIPASGSAWDITRVIPACAVTGEAAGTAAAIAAETSEGMMSRISVSKLQEKLTKQKVILNEEPFHYFLHMK